MRINAENKTDWMIAFHEGLLSPSEREELRAFLVLHPEFNEEFETLGATLLSLDDEPGTDWSVLLKPEIPADADQRAIVLGRYAADDLSPDEKKSLEIEAKEDASLRKELDLLQHVLLKNGEEVMTGTKTLISDADGWPSFLEPKLAEMESKFRLEPDKAVVFSGKEALIRKQGAVIEFRPMLRWAVAACAVLTLWLSIPDNGVDNGKLADHWGFEAELSKSAWEEDVFTTSEGSSGSNASLGTNRSLNASKGTSIQDETQPAVRRVPRLEPRPAILMASLTRSAGEAPNRSILQNQDPGSGSMAMAASKGTPQYMTIQQWMWNKAAEKVGQDKEEGESFGLALLETAIEKVDQKTALPVKLNLDTQKEKQPCRRFSFRIGNLEIARSGCQPQP